MANQLRIPILNPVRFVPVGTPQYEQFYNDWYKNLVKWYEQPDNYARKWFTGQSITLHFHSNFGPLSIDVMDCKGQVLQTITPVAIDTNLIDTGFTTYQAIIVPPAIGSAWYLLMKVGLGDALIQQLSEPMLTVPQNTPGLLTISYRNSFNDGDVVFDTGVTFERNIEAVISRILPKSKRSVWEDQPLNLKTIQAVPYSEFKLMTAFVPDYEADHLNQILCLDTTFFDGVQYTQVEGAEWEPTQVDRYARQAWATSLRPTKNLVSIVDENNNSPAESFAVVYNIETRAFGTFNGNPNSNDLQITKVE